MSINLVVDYTTDKANFKRDTHHACKDVSVEDGSLFVYGPNGGVVAIYSPGTWSRAASVTPEEPVKS